MEKEYRNNVSVKPVLMYREDILELCALIEIQSNEEKNIEIEYKNNEESIKITDIESLNLISDIPPTDYMSLKILVWKERNIVSGLSVSFNHNNISYQLHSKNETWFLGTNSKLRKFFKAKRPWYSPIQRFSLFLSPIAVITSFQHSIDLIKSDKRGALEILCQSGSISKTQGLNDGISDRHRGNITTDS
ncbi:hypothetical protein [Sulfurospirillum barnesii]|uniref:Uncharacterized protein n=1 Tax=Sulfurospirillum barnesii (strain ATCC 700032 / DSM 10660 / SES-3) TaxID=760154 RepID=I3XVX4_SULBS|nr:hypothetical protein [Sulfurospirillum barnesii]AFL68098.1 hypothetical protein Sulba_0794 [Sulfurospirillum barnesii SES-3]